MGEMLPMMMARIDEFLSRCQPLYKRPISRAIRDPGRLTTQRSSHAPPFLCALVTFGIGRTIFSSGRHHVLGRYPFCDQPPRRAVSYDAWRPAGRPPRSSPMHADALLKLTGEENRPRMSAQYFRSSGLPGSAHFSQG